jgi:hypothetical protein
MLIYRQPRCLKRAAGSVSVAIGIEGAFTDNAPANHPSRREGLLEAGSTGVA